MTVLVRAEAGWSGGWVAARLGVRLRTDSSAATVRLDDLLGLAVRRNPRRAHLLVSTVLGKHVPTDPRLVHAAGRLLGGLVDDALRGRGPHAVRALGGSLLAALNGNGGAVVALRDAVVEQQAARARYERESRGGRRDAPLVLGYAETATALGHCVADALGDATYLHSTRRAVPGVARAGGFEEEHSHATSHLLLPGDPALLVTPGPMVLVDDELSTGTTVLNTIRELHRIAPRAHYVVAALVDLRSAADRARTAALAADLGVRLDVVSLAAGEVELPDDVLGAGARLVADTEARARGNELLDHDQGGHSTSVRDHAIRSQGGHSTSVRDHARRSAERGRVRIVDIGWPAGLPEGGRHGFTPDDATWLEAALPAMTDRLAAAARAPRPGQRVLFLGFEELMYAPLRLAAAYSDRVAGRGVDVRYSTTTRSPVLAVDEQGYAIRTALSFDAHDDPDDGPGRRFAYNVAPAAGSAPFDRVVLVVDENASGAALHAPGGPVDALQAVCSDVVVVVLPVTTPAKPLPEPLYGNAFGSYAAAEVAWLLTDLSHADLEAPTEEREEAIQSGGAHYAESLPVEYQPDAAYQQLFHDALTASAPRIAHAVGVVAELIRAERGDDVVLASLARAGTPIGVLIRRWLAREGIEAPHYAVSIVRGRGIDPVALEYLAAHHAPSSVAFVDGWTGKGAIARELGAALDLHAAQTGQRFSPDLAVLADPGGCVPLFGTREDFLIPSACLNSTVSGLVSRTVLNAALTGPRQFHGAKFYADLAPSDVSNAFLDAVSGCFDDVADDVARDWPQAAAADRTPTWVGWAAVERISDEYGVGDVNLVKPGVGEATRVLLRRVPWRVLVRPDRVAELAHVRLLAQQRGVQVVEVDDLPYSCVGLIHPRYTRGATGADGRAARP